MLGICLGSDTTDPWPRRIATPSLQACIRIALDCRGAMQILDPKAGFLVNGCITVSATVLVLEESVQFTRDTDGSAVGEEILR